METVGEDEEKTIEEARIRGTIADVVDPVDYTEESSMEQSNSQTVTFDNHDVNEYEMEDEQVLELFRRNSGLRPEVTERNNAELLPLNKSEGTPAETQQTDAVFHSLNDSNEIADLVAVNQNSPEQLEGTKSSSASDEETENSSSNSGFDSNLSRYYFDGSLPVSAQQDEYPVPKDETKMPLLCHEQPVQQPTSWRNCCGLLELLRVADT